MIDINSFNNFLYDQFSQYEITVDDFKDDLKFIDIDFFLDKPYKLTIASSTDDIRIATVSKIPKLDFSLYDYVFVNTNDAEESSLIC